MITGSTLQQIWPKLVEMIYGYGEEIEDERGNVTKEMTNVVWSVNEPDASTIPEGNPLGEKAIEAYKNQLLDPEIHNFAYTYGNRLNRYVIFAPELTDEQESNIAEHNKTSDKILPGQLFFIDQVQKIIDRLRESSTTRRAIGVTWKLPDDFLGEEVPCMIMVSFLIRNGKLETTAVWRSHDMYGAAVPNFIALRELARHVASSVDSELPLGRISIHSISAHIYDYDFEAAEKI
jgi:thymidylate synthase